MNKTAQFSDIKKSIVKYIGKKQIGTGKKIPPIRSLATELNASPVTIHRAISSLVSEGILEAKRGSGTFVSSPNREKSLTVGIIMPPVFGEVGTGAHFTQEVVRGIENVLNQHNLRGIVCRIREGNVENEEFELIKDLIDSGVKEFVACLFSASNGPVWSFLEKNHIPVVLIDNFAPRRNFNGVATNNYQGGRLAGEHLVSLGHRKIAIALTGMSGFAVESRISGFKDALAEADIKLMPENILRIATESDFHQFDSMFMSKEHPTALFAIHDGVAAEFYRYFREKNISIPNEISVIGFDDNEISRQLTPLLTTVRQPAFKIGARASESLMKLISGVPDENKEINEILLEPELIVRESTSKPKAGK